MPKSSKLEALKTKLAVPKLPGVSMRDPRMVARIVVGVLLAANIAAGLIAFRPWADSPKQLEARLIDLRKQQIERRKEIDKLTILATKSDQARVEGDQFLAKYFLPRRTTSSTLVQELLGMAKSSKIKAKEHSFAFEGVEGSETL